MRRPFARRGRAASALLALGLVVGLAACAADPLAEDYREGSSKGFIAGEFRVVDIPEDERGEPVVFEGTSETGQAVSSADYAGDVLVVNFWYAACAPCRSEADDLETVHQEYQDDNVQFLGINMYDQGPTAVAFAAEHGVTYPSLIAIDDAQLKLAFADATPLTAVPVTLVLDTQGRVAARIISEVKDPSILSTLVRETLAEQS